LYLILKLGLQFQLSICRSSVFLCFIRTATRLQHTVTDIIRFLLAGNDVKAFSPIGGVACDLYLQILKGRPQLYQCLIVTIRLSCTIYDIIQSFLLARNDAMAFSSLGALQMIYNFGFWKGDPDFIFILIDIVCPLVLFRSYSTLFIWLGFQHLGFLG